MNGLGGPRTEARQVLISPATTFAEAPVMNARAMFQRVLSSWAVDVLALRKKGLDRPSLRLTPGAKRHRRAVQRRRAA
jgi:hypothetical protein